MPPAAATPINADPEVDQIQLKSLPNNEATSVPVPNVTIYQLVAKWIGVDRDPSTLNWTAPPASAPVNSLYELIQNIVGHLRHRLIFYLKWSFVLLVAYVSFWRAIVWPLFWNPMLLFRSSTKEHYYHTLYLDERYGRHEILLANGTRYHLVSRGRGPVLLLLHGFPECWFTWRHQLDEWSKYYKVVALDLKGFGGSDKPRNRNSYQLGVLIKDLADIVDQLGGNVTLVGHDLGAVLAWPFAYTYPELVQQLIIMNGPHMTLHQSLQSWDGLVQWVAAQHVALFQIPFYAAILIRLGDYDMMRRFFTSQLKNALAYAGTLSPTSRSRAPSSVATVSRDSSTVRGSRSASPHSTTYEEDAQLELKRLVETNIAALDGWGVLECAFQYYDLIFNTDFSEWMQVPLPENLRVLIVWGERDAILPARIQTGPLLTQLVPQAKVVYVDAGHFLQWERPDLVSAAVLPWLEEQTEVTTK